MSYCSTSGNREKRRGTVFSVMLRIRYGYLRRDTILIEGLEVVGGTVGGEDTVYLL